MRSSGDALANTSAASVDSSPPSTSFVIMMRSASRHIHRDTYVISRRASGSAIPSASPLRRAWSSSSSCRRSAASERCTSAWIQTAPPACHESSASGRTKCMVSHSSSSSLPARAPTTYFPLTRSDLIGVIFAMRCSTSTGDAASSTAIRSLQGSSNRIGHALKALRLSCTI
eukprot:6385206-Prymnesium_polylepis.3